MIARAIAASIPFRWVAGDSVYGVGDIEQQLRRAGKGYVLGVSSARSGWPKLWPAEGEGGEPVMAQKQRTRWSYAEDRRLIQLVIEVARSFIADEMNRSPERVAQMVERLGWPVSFRLACYTALRQPVMFRCSNVMQHRKPTDKLCDQSLSVYGCRASATIKRADVPTVAAGPT
jgi:hypothetical protein